MSHMRHMHVQVVVCARVAADTQRACSALMSIFRTGGCRGSCAYVTVEEAKEHDAGD